MGVFYDAAGDAVTSRKDFMRISTSSIRQSLSLVRERIVARWRGDTRHPHSSVLPVAQPKSASILSALWRFRKNTSAVPGQRLADANRTSSDHGLWAGLKRLLGCSPVSASHSLFAGLFGLRRATDTHSLTTSQPELTSSAAAKPEASAFSVAQAAQELRQNGTLFHEICDRFIAGYRPITINAKDSGDYWRLHQVSEATRNQQRITIQQGSGEFRLVQFYDATHNTMAVYLEVDTDRLDDLQAVNPAIDARRVEYHHMIAWPQSAPVTLPWEKVIGIFTQLYGPDLVAAVNQLHRQNAQVEEYPVGRTRMTSFAGQTNAKAVADQLSPS